MGFSSTFLVIIFFPFAQSVAKLKAEGIGTVNGKLYIGTAESIPPSELIDTTGAGDAFIGAVIYGNATTLFYLFLMVCKRPWYQIAVSSKSLLSAICFKLHCHLLLYFLTVLWDMFFAWFAFSHLFEVFTRDNAILCCQRGMWSCNSISKGGISSEKAFLMWEWEELFSAFGSK